MKVLKWILMIVATTASVAAIVFALFHKFGVCTDCIFGTIDKIKGVFADFFSKYLTEDDFTDLEEQE